MNHDQLPAFHPIYRHSRRLYWLLIGLMLLTLGVAMTFQPSAAGNGVSGACYSLTRTHTGQGADPTAAPTNSEGCGTGQYTKDQAIALTAAPAAGWRVKNWSGTADDSSAETTNTVTMPDEDHTVGVTYEQDETVCYELTLTHIGNGAGPTAEPPKSEGCETREYTQGQAITLTAAPAAGWRVKNWSGTANDSSTNATNTLTMPAEAHTAGVTYEQGDVVCYKLTLNHEGQGEDPTAEPNKSPDCDAYHYVAGAQITLTAAPDEGWRVKSWTGTTGDDSTATTNTVTMPAADHAVSVIYVEIRPIYLSVILQDWPQWQKVGSTELTSLYTVGLCPDDLTKRFAATRDALYSWGQGDWEVMPGAPANVRDFLFLDDCTVYAASFNGGVWQLVDDTWERVGMDALPAARSLALREAKLYVGSRDGVFRYDTTSQTAVAWEPVWTDSNVTRLSRAGDQRLYAADFGLGARFNDACDDDSCDWPEVGVAPFGDAFDVVGSETGTPPDWLVLATARGIYRWGEAGWGQPSAPPQPAGNVFALAVVGDWVFAGVQNGGVWRSTDFGDTWGLFEESPLFTIIDLVVVPGHGLYAVTPNDGIWHYPIQ